MEVIDQIEELQSQNYSGREFEKKLNKDERRLLWSLGLERFCFYFLRSTLILFLIKFLGQKEGEAYHFYDKFEVWVYMGALVVGIGVDFVLRKNAQLLKWISWGLLVMGVLGCFYAPSTVWICTFSLGAGIHRVSILRQLFKSGRNKPVVRLAMLFYLAVNIGAFLGPLANFPFGFENYDMIEPMVVVLILGYSLSVWLASKSDKAINSLPDYKLPGATDFLRVLAFIMILLVNFLLWLNYDLIATKERAYFGQGSSWTYLVTMGALIVVSLLLIGILKNKRFSLPKFLLIGMAVTELVAFLKAILIKNGMSDYMLVMEGLWGTMEIVWMAGFYAWMIRFLGDRWMGLKIGVALGMFVLTDTVKWLEDYIFGGSWVVVNINVGLAVLFLIIFGFISSRLKIYEDTTPLV